MIVEFRDGEHDIPDYLAELMTGIETYKLTVDEAVDEANKRMLTRHVDRAVDEVISQHMSDLERQL